MQFNVNEHVVKMLEIIANRRELRALIYTALALMLVHGMVDAAPGILKELYPYMALN